MIEFNGDIDEKLVAVIIIVDTKTIGRYECSLLLPVLQ